MIDDPAIPPDQDPYVPHAQDWGRSPDGRVLPRCPEPSWPGASRDLRRLAYHYRRDLAAGPVGRLEADARGTRDRIREWFRGRRRQDFGSTAGLLADAFAILDALLEPDSEHWIAPPSRPPGRGPSHGPPPPDDHGDMPGRG